MSMRSTLFCGVLAVLVLYSCFTGRTASGNTFGDYKVTVLAHDREGVVNRIMKACSTIRISPGVETTAEGPSTDLITLGFNIAGISSSGITKINEDLLSTPYVVNVNIIKLR